MTTFSTGTNRRAFVLMTILAVSASQAALANTDRKAVSLMPAHIATVVGINLQQCRMSKVCRKAVNAAQSATGWETILFQLTRASGVTVPQKAKRIYIGLPVDFERSNSAVVILDGPARAVESRPAIQSKVVKSYYRGYPVWTFMDAHKGSFVVLKDRLLFANLKTDLFVMLDHRESARAGNKASSKLRRLDALAARAPTHQDLWFIRDMAALKRAGYVADPLWKQTRVVTGFADFHNGIDLQARLTMSSPGAAAVITGWIYRLQAIPFQSELLGLVGMGSLGDHLKAKPRGSRVDIQMRVRPQELTRVLSRTIAWLH